MIDDLPRGWPAVEVITQGDQPLLAVDTEAIVGDQLLELHELVEAAVDVANRVDGGGPGVKGEARAGHRSP